MEFKRISIDTSKHVFTLHGVDAEDRPILRRNLKRGELMAWFAKQAPTDVVLEACGGSHHWARELGALDHRARLVPPQYVKPYVKRGKNDRNDAEAISEAASRPAMRFVPVKTADQQAKAMILSVRELLVKQQTQLSNAVRGHAAEFGVIAAKGMGKLSALLGLIEADSKVPVEACEAIGVVAGQLEQLATQIAALDRKLLKLHKEMQMSRLLAGIPGVGPINAVTLTLTVDPGQFRSGRHFAAWLGLVPKERSTGGKQRMGRISREGNERLRQLFVLGATSVVQYARAGSKSASAWLLQLLERRPRKVAAVALANKMARIAWAMMTSGEAYRRQPIAA